MTEKEKLLRKAKRARAMSQQTEALTHSLNSIPDSTGNELAAENHPLTSTCGSCMHIHT